MEVMPANRPSPGQGEVSMYILSLARVKLTAYDGRDKGHDQRQEDCGDKTGDYSHD